MWAADLERLLDVDETSFPRLRRMMIPDVDAVVQHRFQREQNGDPSRIVLQAVFERRLYLGEREIGAAPIGLLQLEGDGATANVRKAIPRERQFLENLAEQSPPIRKAELDSRRSARTRAHFGGLRPEGRPSGSGGNGGVHPLAR